MPNHTPLAKGRQAVADRLWRAAYDHLTVADAEGPLELDDVEKLAETCYLLAMEDESVDLWARAYHEHLNREDHPGAARCGFWAAFQLFQAGEPARGGGWLGRAQSALEMCADDCVERGYVLTPVAIQEVHQGNPQAALPMFDQALVKGEQYSDPTLMALARLGQAHARILLGDFQTGLGLLDEVMVSVTADEVVPTVSGMAYCATIIQCTEVFEVRRAHEWTRALSRWCESQPDLVPFRGQCLVHRAELMQLKGDWSDAMREVQLAGEHLANPPGQPAIGMAYYEQGELYRLRGQFTQAEQAYQQANQYGHPPQPGLSLLWSLQGRHAVAAKALEHALGDCAVRHLRARLLAAYVEVTIAGDALEPAREGSSELSTIAKELDAPMVRAMSDHQAGALERALGNPDKALTLLRRAWRGWQDLGAPYEAARVRLLMARVYQELGEPDSASMELDAARVSFEQLGAAADVVAVKKLSEPDSIVAADTILTQRETEVIRLLASGATNREIALELVISEKTVARHVSNIYNKLDLSSRAAATAYAYENGLV